MQFGGVAITCIGGCMHQDMSHEEDPSGLARWVWHQYQGKDGVTLCVISSYHPNGPGKGGPYTVYAQHIQYLLSNDKGDFRDPWQVFITDLE
jgi:hypothetical protein